MANKIGTLGFDVLPFPSCCGMRLICNFHRVTESKIKTTLTLTERWEDVCADNGVNKLAATTTENSDIYNVQLEEGGWVREGNTVENPNTGNMLILWTFTTSNPKSHEDYLEETDDDED